MYYLGGFVLEIIVLFFLSKILHKELSHFLYRFIPNVKIAAYCMAFLFVPGTFFHELSHFLSAVILRVPTGKFTIFPKLQSGSIILGSVQVAKTDPIRRFLIGTSPFFIGIILILGTIYFAQSQNIINNIPIAAALIYFLFTLSNTMFSSKKDMEGALEILLTVAVITGIAYFLGFRIPTNLFESYTPLFKKADEMLFIPIGIDTATLLIIKIFNYFFYRSA